MNDIVLLPFNFKKVNTGFLIVNLVGEHHLLTNDEFEFFVTNDFNSLPSDTIDKLFARHFIAKANDLPMAEQLLSIKLRSRKNFLSSFTSLHMVVLTLRCNCHCDYCHASSKDMDNNNGFDMNINTAKAVVDTIMSSPSLDIKIEFQGGEPMLNWPVLEFIVLESEKINRHTPARTLSFVICTNLLDISDKQLDFIKKHNIALSSSCDGSSELHDLHRKSRIGPSSYHQFVKNLKRSREKLGDDGVSALLTVTRDNLSLLPTVVDQYISLSFNNIFIRALNPYGYAEKNKNDLSYSVDEFLSNYSKALEYIISINKKGIFFVESYASILLQRILTPFATGFVDLQSPAGAGIAGAIYFYDGNVYPADEARMLATTGDESFKLGNVHRHTHKDIFTNKILKQIVLNSCVESMPECSFCAYNQYCGADPIRYYVETGDVVGKRPSSEFCQKNKGVIDILFNYILQNDPDILEIFWSWINRRPIKETNLCGKQAD